MQHEGKTSRLHRFSFIKRLLCQVYCASNGLREFSVSAPQDSVYTTFLKMEVEVKAIGQPRLETEDQGKRGYAHDKYFYYNKSSSCVS